MALPVSAAVAPLGRRVVAFLLDGIILVPVWVVYGVALDTAFGPLIALDAGGTGIVVVAIDAPRVALELALTLLTDAAYYAGCWVRWGMTPGQRACGVAVCAAPTAAPTDGPTPPDRPPAREPDPDRVPVHVATNRWAVLQLLPICAGSLGSAGALPLGVVAAITAGWSAALLLSAAADPFRRGLHDRVAGTVVVLAGRRRA